MKLKIFVEQRPWKDETTLYIRGEDESGKLFYVEPMKMVFNLYKLGETMEPTLRFDGWSAREILPALHSAITDTGYVEKDRSIDAIKYHLEDMRKIVFKDLK